MVEDYKTGEPKVLSALSCMCRNEEEKVNAVVGTYQQGFATVCMILL
jgi:hypothetical protein